MAKLLIVVAAVVLVVWSFRLARRARRRTCRGWGRRHGSTTAGSSRMLPLLVLLLVVTAFAALQGAGAFAGAMGVVLGVVVLTFAGEWVAERSRSAPDHRVAQDEVRRQTRSPALTGRCALDHHAHVRTIAARSACRAVAASACGVRVDDPPAGRRRAAAQIVAGPWTLSRSRRRATLSTLRRLTATPPLASGPGSRPAAGRPVAAVVDLRRPASSSTDGDPVQTGSSGRSAGSGSGDSRGFHDQRDGSGVAVTACWASRRQTSAMRPAGGRRGRPSQRVGVADRADLVA